MVFIPDAPDWVHQAASMITSDIQQHFSINEIASKVGTNSYSLKKEFKQVHGMGPYEYLVNERMKKASELLLQTDDPIKVICSQVGYKSSSSFISVFRRHFGMAPSQWRKKKR
jgi:AraC family transcriptional regulator, transcriptional activator of the genes for pyochelin and ferripyochelin receptors